MAVTVTAEKFPFEGIGGKVRTLANSFHDVQAEADNLLDHLQLPFILALDEIAKEAEITLKRRSRTSQYVAASLAQDGMGVTLHFTPEKFLCLTIYADPRCYGRFSKEVLDKFTQEHGYRTEGVALTKSIQLPETSSQDEHLVQVAQGASFLRDEVKAWGELLGVTA